MVLQVGSRRARRRNLKVPSQSVVVASRQTFELKSPNDTPLTRTATFSNIGHNWTKDLKSRVSRVIPKFLLSP